MGGVETLRLRGDVSAAQDALDRLKAVAARLSRDDLDWLQANLKDVGALLDVFGEVRADADGVYVYPVRPSALFLDILQQAEARADG